MCSELSEVAVASFFSIIIPAYNVKTTICRCLDSLLNQSDNDWEVLIIDGDSTDGTLDLLKRYEHRLPLTVVSEPDHGLYDAMNKGLARACGEWIVILGADDELAPGALGVVRKAAAEHSADIYVGDALRVGPEGEHALGVDPCTPQALVGNVPFCHNAMFASRSAYGVVGSYDVTYKVAADAQWMHRAIRAGMRFHHVGTVLTRFHTGGISSNADLTMPECYRLIQENFPCLSRDEAEYLLFVSKGWDSGEELEVLLARHPEELALAQAARMARTYAPHCAQRRLEQAMHYPRPLWEKIFKRLNWW